MPECKVSGQYVSNSYRSIEFIVVITISETEIFSMPQGKPFAITRVLEFHATLIERTIAILSQSKAIRKGWSYKAWVDVKR